MVVRVQMIRDTLHSIQCAVSLWTWCDTSGVSYRQVFHQAKYHIMTPMSSVLIFELMTVLQVADKNSRYRNERRRSFPPKKATVVAEVELLMPYIRLEITIAWKAACNEINVERNTPTFWSRWMQKLTAYAPHWNKRLLRLIKIIITKKSYNCSRSGTLWCLTSDWK